MGNRTIALCSEVQGRFSGGSIVYVRSRWLHCGWPRLAIAGVGLIVMSCGTKQMGEPRETASTKVATPDPVGSTDSRDAAAPVNPVHTVSLSGDTPVPVPNTDFKAYISGASHKTSTPLAYVRVLLSLADAKAEVRWQVQAGEIDTAWRKIEGRRWDADSSTYLEEEIPGWLVRLDSVDDSSSGGSPTALTISVKPTEVKPADD